MHWNLETLSNILGLQKHQETDSDSDYSKTLVHQGILTSRSCRLRNFQRFPREVVHQILDDLPIVKVLQILSHNEDVSYFLYNICGVSGVIFQDQISKVLNLSPLLKCYYGSEHHIW